MKPFVVARDAETVPGQVVTDVDGTIGVALRAMPVAGFPFVEDGKPRRGRGIITRGQVAMQAAGDVVAGDHLTVNVVDGRTAGRSRGKRGRRGWKTVRGAYWQGDCPAGRIGVVQLGGRKR